MSRRRTMLLRCLALPLVALVGLLPLGLLPVAATPAGPASAASPAGPAGAVLGTRPAHGPSALPEAGRAVVVRYRSTSVRGRPVPMTGLVLVPRGRAPRGGWPMVTYGHMTTGAADACAPTRATTTSTELRRMAQGDKLAARLLEAGVAVLRPDYEGLGAPGPHPYLIGDSLATATVDLVAAARAAVPGLGRDWVAAGHSEGAVSALFSAEAGRRPPPGVRLRGVAAFAPVSRIDLLLRLLRPVPVTAPLVDMVVALAGLMLHGAAAVDRRLARLLTRGGLSPQAEALLPHLEQRCLTGLAASDSWGGLAPAQVTGPRGAEAVARLVRVLRANDVRTLRLRRGVPVRVDLGVLDEVAPLPVVEALVRTYRRAGSAVTVGRWLATHSTVMDPPHAPAAAAAWIRERLVTDRSRPAAARR